MKKFTNIILRLFLIYISFLNSSLNSGDTDDKDSLTEFRDIAVSSPDFATILGLDFKPQESLPESTLIEKLTSQAQGQAQDTKSSSQLSLSPSSDSPMNHPTIPTQFSGKRPFSQISQGADEILSIPKPLAQQKQAAPTSSAVLFLQDSRQNSLNEANSESIESAIKEIRRAKKNARLAAKEIREIIASRNIVSGRGKIVAEMFALRLLDEKPRYRNHLILEFFKKEPGLNISHLSRVSGIYKGLLFQLKKKSNVK